MLITKPHSIESLKMEPRTSNEILKSIHTGKKRGFLLRSSCLRRLQDISKEEGMNGGEETQCVHVYRCPVLIACEQ